MKLVRWLRHWTFQGLKLWLFAMVAGMCLTPFYLPFWILEDNEEKLSGMGWAGQLLLVGGRGVCLIVAISVFTAVLAAQLESHPLRGLERKSKE